MLEKKVINRCRNEIKAFIRVYKDNLINHQDLLDLYDANIDEYVKQTRLMQSFFKQKGSYAYFQNASIKESRDFFQKQSKELAYSIKALENILGGLSKEGFQKSTFLLPELIKVLALPDYDFMRLFLSGIKYNGEHKDLSSIEYDLERALYKYEQKLAQFITDDFYIEKDKEMKFLTLLNDYILFYFKYNEEKYKDDTCLYYRINEILMDNMENFMFYSLDRKKDALPKTVQVKKDVKPNIDTERLKLEEARELLREERARKIAMKEAILKELLEDNIELYNKAKVSNNYDATSITNDIDAVVDLYMEASDEEKEELKREVISYIVKLQAILNKKEASIEYFPIIFYKDSNLVPLFYQNLEEIDKGDYIKVFNELNKLYNNVTNSNYEIYGINAPFKVYEKGNNFKIFYTVYKGYIIIFGVFSKKEAFNQIKLLVQSKDIKNFYDATRRSIDEGISFNEANEYNMIIDKLSTSSKVREKLGK